MKHRLLCIFTSFSALALIGSGCGSSDKGGGPGGSGTGTSGDAFGQVDQDGGGTGTGTATGTATGTGTETGTGTATGVEGDASESTGTGGDGGSGTGVGEDGGTGTGEGTGWDFGGEDFAYNCDGNNDCSAWCVQGPDSSICTENCVEDCPTGWDCKGVQFGSDVQFVCVPKEANTCGACTSTAECGGVGLCAADSAGATDGLCLVACAGPLATCGPGFVCESRPLVGGGQVSVCAPEPDLPCCGRATEGITAECSNASEIGVCTGSRLCEGADGWGSCDAPPAAPEICNQADDDCDGQTDEDDVCGGCVDTDDDGICNNADNCPSDPNPGQEDADSDGQGDACDPCPNDAGVLDTDNDGVCADNCPNDPNPGQEDADNDGQGDVCDECPDNPGTCCVDSDDDGVCDGDDNCPANANPDQQDTDGDGLGDLCDPCPEAPGSCNAGSIHGTVTDGNANLPIPGATVTVWAGACGNGDPVATAQTDGNGQYNFDLEAGIYCVEVTAGGYEDASAGPFPLAGGEDRQVDFTLTVPGQQEYVTICGTVTEIDAADNASPSEGASVTAAGGDPSNVVAGTNSDVDGQYCVSIPVQWADYFVSGKKEGFQSDDKSTADGDFAVSGNTTVIVDLTLEEITGFGDCFFDDFEIEGDWTVSNDSYGVQWHRRQNGLLLNSAVGQCVELPPDEDCNPGAGCQICAAPTDLACIPQAGAVSNSWSGEWAYYWGREDTGNFMQDSGDCDGAGGGNGGSGGGDDPNGNLTSPVISLPADKVLTLSFRAWWEIESVDPEAPSSGYDEMRVEIVVDGNSTLIGWMNPAVDANGEAYQPYTSGGFDTVPVWNLYEFDLTPYAGQDVQIRLRFSADDSNYNAFRGWLIDDLAVSGCL